ncbi:MAG: T9SS type A sorting domain-containing protein [Prevotellaceae bacterium]|jgi:hypothetical protein|nr:T9SS type A sorting domain-containing protein [Prevotellaceae bacterium]
MSKQMLLLAGAMALQSLAYANDITDFDGTAADAAPLMAMGGSLADVNVVSRPLDAVRVFPNPFVNDVHVTHAEGCTLRVYTRSGALVLTKTITYSDEIVQLSRLAANVYLFRISQARPLKGELSLRVVKK